MWNGTVRGREDKVKVLGLFGSPRRGGNTDLLLEEMLRGAEEAGAHIERIIISKLKFSPCVECHGCTWFTTAILEYLSPSSD